MTSDNIRMSVGGHSLTLMAAGARDEALMENLANHYLYDFSEYTGDGPDERGRFADEHLSLYLTGHGRAAEGWMPYLVRVDGKPAGFVLVKTLDSSSFGTDYSISEFFIMRRWRGYGIGRAVAGAIFDQYLGKWEVKVIRENRPALAFWRRMIGEYAGGRYQEIDSRSEEWDGTVFVFEAGGES